MTTDIALQNKRLQAKRKLAKDKFNSSNIGVQLQDGSVVNAPAKSSVGEIAFHNDVQNNSKDSFNFFGFSDQGPTPWEQDIERFKAVPEAIGNYAKGTIKGIVQSGVALQSAGLAGHEKKLNRVQDLESGERSSDWKDFWFTGRGAPMWKDKPTFKEHKAKIANKIKSIKQVRKDMPSVLKGMVIFPFASTAIRPPSPPIFRIRFCITSFAASSSESPLYSIKQLTS